MQVAAGSTRRPRVEAVMLAGEADVRSRPGTWSLPDRRRWFELACPNARAPFFNPEAYH